MKKILVVVAVISTFGFQLSTCKAQDAVYKLLSQEWTINADGTSDYHYRHEVQILRNRALVAYADKGETFVVYNPDFEELTINEVYTIQKDGTRVNMPQNAFVYQLPAECADCGRFNHLRELAMIHTGMELGCTIVVDYTIHRQNDLIYEYIPLMRECPIDSLVLKVTYPTGYKPQFTVTGGPLKISTKTNKIAYGEGTETFGYIFCDVEQAPQEAYMPADIIPVMHIFNGVPEFTPVFDRQGLEAASGAAYHQIDSREDRENIVAIQNFVIDNIHLNDISPAKLGYVHATAAEVWQTGCGTATDKAVLLAAMLNEVGYSARVIGENYDEVGVMVDTLEYRLDVRHKGPMTLYGEAKDEVNRVAYNRNHEVCSLDTLGDGFYRLTIDRISESPAINVANLAYTRTAPLATPQCDIAVRDEYILTKGVKMVGGKVSHELTFEGIGHVEVCIKQKGKKLTVDRKLKVEKSVINPEDYASFRQLMAIWQSVDKVLLQSK